VKAGQIHLVGMDDLPETLRFIQEGVIDAVKVQRQREIGYWAIKYLAALNEGHTVPKEHLIGTELVTKDNL
jgi:ribose transport system substrate-binding protein